MSCAWPELRAAYSRSGLSHLLAVSGLHTGIVFALVNLLLWWLPLLRRGHLLRNLLAAACIWIYVAAAGFPPSAVRAAVMFTMLQSALASASEYNGLNALAAAAFGMLLWNPACALSFSKMTFPHQMMRVVLLEQIYRSERIQRNEPYHK